MRVQLKGIHAVKVKLASGATATYYYAWRKGPRLVGEPGSPEFIASYHAAIQSSRREPDRSNFHSVIAGYKASQDFLGLSKRSQLDYLKHIAKIEEKFGTLPLAALDDARVTKDFLEWRDSMAKAPRQADYAWTILMRLLSWARSPSIGRRSALNVCITPPVRRRFGKSNTLRPSWRRHRSHCNTR